MQISRPNQNLGGTSPWRLVRLCRRGAGLGNKPGSTVDHLEAASCVETWRMLWLVTAGWPSSTPIGVRHSPVRPSPPCSPARAFGSSGECRAQKGCSPRYFHCAAPAVPPRRTGSAKVSLSMVGPGISSPSATPAWSASCGVPGGRFAGLHDLRHSAIPQMLPATGRYRQNALERIRRPGTSQIQCSGRPTLEPPRRPSGKSHRSIAAH